MAPTFLSLQDVLEIHRDPIRRYGGRPGARDLDGLESAIAMPRSGTRDRFLHADLFEMAAAYLFLIARNHPFVDGNKRTGVVAAIVFLALNGVEVVIEEDELVATVVAAAQGKRTKSQLADFFRKHATQ